MHLRISRIVRDVYRHYILVSTDIAKKEFL